MKLVVPPLPEGLFERAYHACGEKRIGLAQLAFPTLLGPAWRFALLAFAYLKLFDDLVDENADSSSAADAFAVHRALAERIYAGDDPAPELPFVQRLGAHVFHFDRSNGYPIRHALSDTVASMAIDLARRGKVLSEAELEANFELGGGATLRGVGWFAAPELDFCDAWVSEISGAYVHADSLIDLEHDLAFGVINVPAEAVARGIDPARPDASLAGWVREEARRCEQRFDVAFARLGEIPSRRVRAVGHLMLRTKRRKLRSFLAAGGWPRPTQETLARGST